MQFFASIILFASFFTTFECANESANFGRIVRGRIALKGQFPYAVKMDLKTEDEEYLCGAALIGARWLLTAAHCIHDVKSLRVYLGCLFVDRADVIYDVPLSNIIIHPKFNWYSRFNDIALIRIPQTILNAKIAIVRLPKMRLFPPKYDKAYATACGWGLTSTYGRISKRLQYGRFQILSTKKCQSLNISQKQICTAMRLDLAATCDGDSGGALVLEKTGELVGISSYGDGDCDYGPSVVFTRVTSYLAWIKSVSGIYYR